MIGSGFPYSEFLPKEGQARGVQIDLKPDMLSLRYPMEVNLVGDSARNAARLLPMLKEKTDRSWRTRSRRMSASGGKTWKPRDGERQPGQSAARGLGAFAAPAGAGDHHQRFGSCANWYARDLKIRRGMMARCRAALHRWARRALRDRRQVRPSGPSCGCLGRRRRDADEQHGRTDHRREILAEWANPNWIVCVFNNQDLNQVTWEQRVMEGDPKFNATQQIPDVPYHRFAELIGLKGIFVDKPERLASAWDEALASDRPVVLEVKTDPEVPPLPPHITLKQAKKFTSIAGQGDPEKGVMLVGTAKQVLGSSCLAQRY